MADYQFGDIVDVENVPDPWGRNPKTRPVLIITPNDETAKVRQLVGVAISSTSLPPKPTLLPDDWVELPFADRGLCMTGLSKRSVAKCQWIVEVPKDRITRKRGVAPSDRIQQVIQYLLRTKRLPPTT